MAFESTRSNSFLPDRALLRPAEIPEGVDRRMTCNPVAGSVQIPCIERCAFAAVKAWTGSGR